MTTPNDRPTKRDLVEGAAERRRASERETLPAPPDPDTTAEICPACVLGDGSQGAGCPFCLGRGSVSFVEAAEWRASHR